MTILYRNSTENNTGRNANPHFKHEIYLFLVSPVAEHQTPSHQNLYLAVLNPNVTGFGDRAFKDLIKENCIKNLRA